jgi:hypothetical protein
MSNYRICENKYGYFKIQKYIPSKKFLGFKIKKDQWLDILVWDTPLAYKPKTYKNREDALIAIDNFERYDLEKQKESNNEWKCD